MRLSNERHASMMREIERVERETERERVERERGERELRTRELRLLISRQHKYV